jgi:competence protein ComEC
MIGAPSSAVRAGIFGGLFLLAQHLGRLSAASRVIIFAATFMLLLNPLLLKVDIGFQLSFLAILGLVYLQQPLSGLFKKIPNPKIFPLQTALSATMAAQVFTLPILIYNFGYVSIVSPIANILIVPVLAPLTILIFIFGLSGIIFYPLAYVFSWIVWLFLSYIIFVVDLFSRVSFASLAIDNANWLGILVYYLALALFVVWYKKRQRIRLLTY